MKELIKSATVCVPVLSLLAACVSQEKCPKPVVALDTMMYMQNFKGPFITRDFAEHLGLLVTKEKYSASVFDVPSSATVEDRGETWWVTVINSRWSPESASGNKLIAKRLIVHIRKTNGEIVTID